VILILGLHIALARAVANTDQRSWFAISDGSLSYHPATPSSISSRFERRLSHSGRLIHTDSLALRLYPSPAYSLAILYGTNSVAAPIYGAFATRSLWRSRFTDLSIFAGSYHQQREPFNRRRLASPWPYMPILAPVIAFRAPIEPGIEIESVNILSPVLTNHSIALRFALD
jgi:hypothetical protein